MFAGANRECICLFMLLVLSALVFACHGLMYRRTITNTRRLLALRMTVQCADLLPDDTGASLFFHLPSSFVVETCVSLFSHVVETGVCTRLHMGYASKASALH